MPDAGDVVEVLVAGEGWVQAVVQRCKNSMRDMPVLHVREIVPAQVKRPRGTAVRVGRVFTVIGHRAGVRLVAA